MGDVKLYPRVDPATLPAQPLSVQQVRAGEVGADAGTPKPLDRLAVTALGSVAIAQQRARTSFDAERPVRAADAGDRGQPAEGIGGHLGASDARRRLNELDRLPGRRDPFAQIF